LAVLFAIFIGIVIVLADTANLGFLHRVYEFPYGDKAGHFSLYGTLTLLANLALFELRSEGDRRHLALEVSLTIAALVSLEELSQLWLPTRSPDWFDLLAGYAGIAVAACLAVRLRPASRSTAR
jgi:polysaccharide biosynthesis protein VpsQ